MKIVDKIINKQNLRKSAEAVTIVCLGDSVTEGCFECYINEQGRVATVYERHNSYSVRLQQMLSTLYPTVPFNIINSGFSGGWAHDGVDTLERDVLRFKPNLVIVSYGLNDSSKCANGLDAYAKSLSTIFEKVKQSGAEIIFLTENYMCTKVSPHLDSQALKDLAEDMAKRQNAGELERYFEKAKELCGQFEVEVCDLYSVWQAMEKSGVNVTELLSNKLNHPIREYHYYIAVKLLEKIMGI